MRSDSKRKYTNAVGFKNAAIYDGWKASALYAGESAETAARLVKNKFTIKVITRVTNRDGRRRFESSLKIWGPDGLLILVPERYSYPNVVAGLNTCTKCGKFTSVSKYQYADRRCKMCSQGSDKVQVGV